MKRILFLMLLAVLFSRSEVHACNGLDMTLANAATDLTTNNFPSLNLTVTRNNINNGCNYFVVINYGTASSFSNRRLELAGGYTYPVQIYKDSGRTQIIKSLADATSANDVLNGTYANGSGSTTTTLVYRPYLDPNLYNRYGTYSQTFTASLYQGDLGASPQLRRSRTFTLNYTQARRMDLSIVNTGAAFDVADTNQVMDFGNLLATTSQKCDLVLQYNAGYRLTISSTNNGRLKHETNSDTITYSFLLNGITVNLSGGSTTLANVTGMSPASGTRLPIEVIPGSASGKSNGQYTDTVTLSVVSVE